MVDTPTLGWICPLCHHGVSPTVNVCPCRSVPLGVLPQVPEPYVPTVSPTVAPNSFDRVWISDPPGSTRSGSISTSNQSWFWAARWQTMEAQANADITDGRYTVFNSMDEMIADMDDAAWQILTPDHVDDGEAWTYE